MVAPIGRVQVIGSGFTGAPGLIQLYWNGAAAGAFTGADATAAIAAVHTLLDSCKSAMSSLAQWQVQPTVETIEATNGIIIGVVAGTPVASVTGTATGNVLTAEGVLIQWLTGVVVGRRLLRGRTFLNPGAIGSIAASGLVNGTVQAAVLAAANVYLASAPAQPVVWHRPSPWGTGSNGRAAVIVGAGVPATIAVLRSRRD